MKQTFLLPNKFKKAGWLILIFTTALFLLYFIIGNEELLKVKTFAILNTVIFGNPKERSFFTIIKADIFFTLFSTLYLIGALLVAFSKEKAEDEYISSMRLNACLWAILVNYLILLFALLFIYGFGFLYIMVANMFTILLIFILRFHYLLLKSKKLATHEK